MEASQQNELHSCSITSKANKKDPNYLKKIHLALLMKFDTVEWMVMILRNWRNMPLLKCVMLKDYGFKNYRIKI